jgi:hypothetical protein
MFRKYTGKHKQGIFVGFIKPSECQMGGELISLLHLLRLKDALRSTINSKEFLDLNNFKEECCVLNNDNYLLAAAGDNGRRFGHHYCRRTSSNSIIIEVNINELISTLIY